MAGHIDEMNIYVEKSKQQTYKAFSFEINNFSFSNIRITLEEFSL